MLPFFVIATDTSLQEHCDWVVAHTFHVLDLVLAQMPAAGFPPIHPDNWQDST